MTLLPTTAHLKMDPWDRKFFSSFVTYLESYCPVAGSLWYTELGLSDDIRRSRSEIYSVMYAMPNLTQDND